MTFDNSILAGTVLARENIQSEGFVAGASGWIVERDGDAEFNSIVVRGKVVSVGSLYTVTIDNGEIIISLNSNPVFGLTMNPEQFQFSTTAFVSNWLEQNSSGIGFRTNATSRGVYLSRATGFLTMATIGPFTPEGWNALPGANGYGGGSYKLLPDGNVILDGQVAGGVAASPIQVGTLPVGYRPRAYMEVMVARGGAFGTNKITIDTAGVVTQWTPDATYLSSLAGIVFSTLA